MTWPSFPAYVREKATLFGERIFLRDAGTETAYSYRAFDELSDRLAGGFRSMGLAAGDRVALLHPNHTDFVLAYFSIIKAGAVAVPINPVYTAREVSYILNDSGARWLISTHAFLPLLEEIRPSVPQVTRAIVKREGEDLAQALDQTGGELRPFADEERGADDLAFIFYTSGTTGSPKGVMLTHRNVIFGGANTAQSYGLRESDVTLACLPLVHIFANASPVLGSFNSGGCAVVMERFQTEPVFQVLEREGITWFPGVPTMFAFLLNAFDERTRAVGSLRMGLSGGASLSVEHLNRFESSFQAPVLEVYGLTESTGLVTGNPVYGVRKVGSIGINVSGVSARILDPEGRDVPRGEVGEIVFRGPNATPGYWNRPDTTAAALRDGWVRTGDLAWQDEEGYYFIVGRKDELIISGGYNVYPREVEEVLYLHGGIAEAAVVGVGDPNLGQVPKAYVSPRAGHRLTAEGVQAFCRVRLAPYKVPKSVEVLTELPKSSTGKILKKALPGN